MLPEPFSDTGKDYQEPKLRNADEVHSSTDEVTKLLALEGHF